MKPVTNGMMHLNGKRNKIFVILLKILSISKNRQQITAVSKYIQIKASIRDHGNEDTGKVLAGVSGFASIP